MPSPSGDLPAWQERLVDEQVHDIISAGILRAAPDGELPHERKSILLEPDNARSALFEELCAMSHLGTAFDPETVVALTDNYVLKVQNQNLLALSAAETALAHAGVEVRPEAIELSRHIGSLVYGYEISTSEYLMTQWDDVHRQQPVMRDWRELAIIERTARLVYAGSFDVVMVEQKKMLPAQVAIYVSEIMNATTSLVLREQIDKWVEGAAEAGEVEGYSGGF